MMLSHKITHYTDDDDAAETGVFYDTLISCIDEITHIANSNGNGYFSEKYRGALWAGIYRRYAAIHHPHKKHDG